MTYVEGLRLEDLEGCEHFKEQHLCFVCSICINFSQKADHRIVKSNVTRQGIEP